MYRLLENVSVALACIGDVHKDVKPDATHAKMSDVTRYEPLERYLV